MYNVFTKGPKKGIPKTYRDSVIRYIVEGLELINVPNRSGKYLKFVKEEDVGKKSVVGYFVGSKGAVRIGPNATNSLSVSHSFKLDVQRWEVSEDLPRNVA